jgi:hypothetical protein
LFLDPFLNCDCQFCWGKPLIPGIARTILARITERLKSGKGLSGEGPVILRMLARSREPIPGPTLQRILGIDDRAVKALMRELCDDWAIPIIATRKPPYGYFVAQSAEEFLEWGRVTRSQAISMLARFYHLFRTNFPELAGQQSFDFVSDITTELQAAIQPAADAPLPLGEGVGERGLRRANHPPLNPLPEGGEN